MLKKTLLVAMLFVLATTTFAQTHRRSARRHHPQQSIANNVTRRVAQTTPRLFRLDEPGSFNRNSEAWYIWNNMSQPGIILQDAIIEFYKETDAGLAARKTAAAQANYVAEMLEKHDMLTQYKTYVKGQTQALTDLKLGLLAEQSNSSPSLWDMFMHFPGLYQTIAYFANRGKTVAPQAQLEAKKTEIFKEGSLLLDRFEIAEMYDFMQKNKAQLSKKNLAVLTKYKSMSEDGHRARKYLISL
ncbi:MAG: hypothetical protein J6X06_00600 [Elusimicrobiaceae bacterium]|nr:hypothetical protein [Elusimicrobiaceae bacterium]